MSQSNFIFDTDRFANLSTHKGLAELDQDFFNYLHDIEPELCHQLHNFREIPDSLSRKELSALIIAIAPLLESFIADRCNIKNEIKNNQDNIQNIQDIFEFKKTYIQKFAKRRLHKNENLKEFDELNQIIQDEIKKQFSALSSAASTTHHATKNNQKKGSHNEQHINNNHTDTPKNKCTPQISELLLSKLGVYYLKDKIKYSEQIENLSQWCIHILKVKKNNYTNWVMFNLPDKLDYDKLLHTERTDVTITIRKDKLRHRDGFALTDNRMSQLQIQDEANYCVYCHKNEGDYCSTGFPDKKNKKTFKKNPLDDILTGCPLDEKISEMNLLKSLGHTIAPLAVVMIDNPMCPATGHRICNDCMKACIYQKQSPVNIPEIETRVLTDVLDLPWGVEIYDLLTKWNPLRPQQFVTQDYNGKKVMIAGMGPAGFTLAHHLLMEGFAVVGFDGLKIEDLDADLINKPIKDYHQLEEALDKRTTLGFGGVAEYGITVRWDKNFLKLIYLNLLRRPHFQIYGNTRFGGTVTVEDAWQLGFDHLAIAVGAGLPKALPIPGSMAPGMRQANDFLMALQLTGAAKESSLANLQIRMPIVIIGGGLTGVDAATEAQAYYIKQVEKVLFRYESLIKKHGEEKVRKVFIKHEDKYNNTPDNIVKTLESTGMLAELNTNLNQSKTSKENKHPIQNSPDKYKHASLIILDELLAHGKQVKAERNTASLDNRHPDFLKLIHSWGGVTIVYRRHIQLSPAYINNHEELDKALEEGLFYKECLEPKSANLDSHGHITSLTCRHRQQSPDGQWEVLDEDIILPSKTILVATGAQPNIAYEFEHRGTFNKNGLDYEAHEYDNNQLTPVPTAEHCKSDNFGPFTSYSHNVIHGSTINNSLEHIDKDISSMPPTNFVSFLGDTHPVFHGSVVKAIASAMRTYPKIIEAINTLISDKYITPNQDKNNKSPYTDSKPELHKNYQEIYLNIAKNLNINPTKIINEYRKTYDVFKQSLEYLFKATIVNIETSGCRPPIITIKAPMIAHKASPGQFVRLQNYERHAQTVNNTLLQTDIMALPISNIDKANGTIELIPLRQTANREILKTLTPGMPIAAMGPTGVRSKIPEGSEVLIIGDHKAIPQVLSLSNDLKNNHNKLYFIGYFENTDEIYRQTEVEQVCDKHLWVINNTTNLDTNQSSDIDCAKPNDLQTNKSPTSNSTTTSPSNFIYDNIHNFEKNIFNLDYINFDNLHSIYLIGDGEFLRVFKKLKKNNTNLINANTKWLASVYAPMQCMLKGICAQCLQWQIDPETGDRTKAVYACSWQHQPLELIDIDNMNERAVLNETSKILNYEWARDIID